jgi:hypothetical protein
VCTQPPPLGRSLSKAPSGVILNLATVGLPGCDDPDASLSGVIRGEIEKRLSHCEGFTDKLRVHAIERAFLEGVLA